MRVSRGLLVSVSGFTLAAAAAPVLAQDAADNTELADDGASEGASQQGETIVVTARRREERLQDVPISVAVIGGDQIESQAIFSFQDFSGYVPNLAIAKTAGADQIIMRGTGSGSSTPTIDQSVAMFIDGVFNGHSRQFAQPLFDIERVEVLRGPQGALVGKNTSAGAINITTRRPGDETEGFLLSEYNITMNGPKFQAGATVPMSDDLGIRLAMHYTDFGGYIDNTLASDEVPKRKEYAGRVTLAYQSANGFSAALKGEVSEVELRGTPSQIIAPSLGNFPDFESEGGVSSEGSDFDFVDNQVAALDLSYEFDWATLQSITSYSAYQSDQGVDSDFLDPDFFFSTFAEDFEQFSQEIRLISPAGERIEWALGVYAQTSDLREDRTTVLIGFAPNLTTYRLFNQDEESISLYANVKFRVSEQFHVDLSARQTFSDKDADFAIWQGDGVHITQQGSGAPLRAFDGGVSDSLFDPAVKLQYFANDNLMLYAGYAQGSKASGFQGGQPNTTLDNFAFSPENSRSYEAGAKWVVPGVGHLNLALFDVRYDDLQLAAVVPVSAGSGSFDVFVDNAGAATTRGAELDARLNLSDVFGFDVAAAYTPKAEFDSYPIAQCYTGRPADNPDGSCDLTGQRLSYAPKLTLNVTPRIEVPIGDFNFNLSSTMRYKSSYFTDGIGDPVVKQDSIVKVDARAAISAADGRWELALIGRNLTNKATIGQGSGAFAANVIAPDARQVAVDPARTVALQLGLKF